MSNMIKKFSSWYKGSKIHEKSQALDQVIFSSRWILYPVNIGLLLALIVYVIKFLGEVFELLVSSRQLDIEDLKVIVIGFVDAGLVANLVIMVIQGGHQIFIRKFANKTKSETPGYLDNIDTGILKVKVAQSIAVIMLVQALKDCVNLKELNWELVQHRIILGVYAVGTMLVLALVWRITHPASSHGHDDKGVQGHDKSAAGSLDAVAASLKPNESGKAADEKDEKNVGHA